MKISVTPEGRKDIWIPEKKSLKTYIRSKKLDEIHNFVSGGPVLIGADHSTQSVLKDIDAAERLGIFTDPHANMGHALALIINNRLECYDIGPLTEQDLIIKKKD